MTRVAVVARTSGFAQSGELNLQHNRARKSSTYSCASPERVGAANLTLAPGEVDGRGTSSPSDAEGYAVVTVTSDSGVQGYASVVDNITGDATTILMK